MSRVVVALMLRSGVPFDVWLRQPDGVIETAALLYSEMDDTQPRSAGPQMSG